MKLHWKFQGEGGTNQMTILGGGMDTFCNHTIPVYGNAKFSAILSDSKYNSRSLIMWNTISQPTYEDFFNQNMHEKKY